MGTHFEIWAGKWCFEMSGEEESKLRWKYQHCKIMQKKLEEVYK